MRGMGECELARGILVLPYAQRHVRHVVIRRPREAANLLTVAAQHKRAFESGRLPEDALVRRVLAFKGGLHPLRDGDALGGDHRA